VKGVERNPEAKRRRYLDGNELARLTDALAAHDDQPAADIVRLLMLTGARRGEVLSARWLDLDLKAGTWTKPGATTKQKTEHHVPLSAPARLLLASLKDEAEKDGVTSPCPTSSSRKIRRCCADRSGSRRNWTPAAVTGAPSGTGADASRPCPSR
jgi:integrase